MGIPYSIIVYDEVATKLSCFYPRDKVEEWMRKPVKLFEGKSAIEMIEAGRDEAVRALADRMVAGATAARGTPR